MNKLLLSQFEIDPHFVALLFPAPLCTPRLSEVSFPTSFYSVMTEQETKHETQHSFDVKEEQAVQTADSEQNGTTPHYSNTDLDVKAEPQSKPQASSSMEVDTREMVEPLDDRPHLRPNKLLLPKDIREQKPPAGDVVVIALGSFGIRYGFASDSTPRKIFPAVAFPRRPKSVADAPEAALCIPAHITRSPEELATTREEFDTVTQAIEEELALGERRRGGGRPIPWKASVEPMRDTEWTNADWLQADTSWRERGHDIVIGRDVHKLWLDKDRAQYYDIVFPIWDGKLLFDCGAPTSLVRQALEAIFSHIVSQLLRDRANARKKHQRRGANGKEGDSSHTEKHMDNEDTESKIPLAVQDGFAKSFVTVVVPETAHRRDVAEIVGAIFQTRELQAAAVFVHQSTVSCALGAGLATCAVVDIGHSATTVACVEDGMICGESRIHLKYGSFHIQKAFDVFLNEHSDLQSIITTDYENTNAATEPYVKDEETLILSKITEQMGGFNVDENDTLKVSTVKAPNGRSVKVSLGVGIRTVPCYGLIYPRLLKCAYELKTNKLDIPARGPFEKNSEEDNFVSDIFNDLRRSGIATAALPIGLFANDPGQPAEKTVHSETASIVDAIIWSVARAVEIKRPDQQSRTPDHYRRYLNAIVLAGGGASIDGIALALEGRIKKGFQDAGVNISDVTVIDGGKGKGDEELAAAAAVLKDVDSDGGLIDDTDTASLPWKGGAVMVEADVVNEYWVYRDDWEARNVRALRERAPFYW